MKKSLLTRPLPNYLFDITFEIHGAGMVNEIMDNFLNKSKDYSMWTSA